MAGVAPYTRPLIFVVDPDKDHQGEFALLLARVGYRVRGFASAEACLAALAVTPPACIVTDLTLPGMGGLDLTRQLRGQGDSTPVIVVTSKADVAAAVDAFRSRVTDFVIRPFVARELIGRLDAIVAPDPVSRLVTAH